MVIVSNPQAIVAGFMMKCICIAGFTFTGRASEPLYLLEGSEEVGS